MSGSSSNFTQTPNLGLFKPVYAADVGFWGTHLNANADTLDTVVGKPPIVSVLNYDAKGDGVTDDTAAIQAVLNANAGKATVLIPNTGSPYMVQPLSLPTGTDLLLFGTLHGTGAANGVLAISANNVTVRGAGVVDANNTAPAAIVVSGATAVRISGVTMQNAANWNLNVVASTNVILDSVRILGGNNSPEFAQGCADCWITNSYINGPANDGGFAFYGGVTNSGAIGNVFTNALHYGCSVVSDPGQPTPCTGIVISNNVIFGNGTQGIGVLASGVGGAHQNITISDNELYNNCTKPYVAGPGLCDIFLASCSYSVVANNKLHHCGNGGAGIRLSYTGYGPNAGIIITGNSISDEGQGTATGVGIVMNSNSNDIAISGNHIFDDQTTKTMLNGIAGPMGPTSTIVGNHFGALIGNPLNITPASDTVAANSRSGGQLFSIPYGTLSTVASMQWANASGFPRWFVGNAGNAEGGSDSGSDFQIVAVHDNGTLIGQALGIKRSTEVVTFGVAPTITALPANATNDAAAATAGVPVGGFYRNGSVLQIRVA